MAHSLFEDRPDWLSYRAKDGVYTTYLPSREGQSSDFKYFVDRAIFWSDKATSRGRTTYGYSVLDTFMADFLTPSHLESMLRRSNAENPLRLLLTDPYSAFGEARATAINDGTAEDRASTGARILISAIENFRGRDAKGLDRASYTELLQRLDATLEDSGVPMSIRYYGVIPSGPMLFLKDIVLAGSYSVNLSSMRLPWMMIVDDPITDDDRFNVYYDEFENIWDNYSVASPGGADEQSKAAMRLASKALDRPYFISYSQGADMACADHIEVLLHRRGKRLVRDEITIDIGSSFENILPLLIESSGTFIALFSESYADSQYCMGELQAAIEQSTRTGEPRLAILLLSESETLANRIPLRVRNRLTAQAHTRSAREHTIAKLVDQEMRTESQGGYLRF